MLYIIHYKYAILQQHIRLNSIYPHSIYTLYIGIDTSHIEFGNRPGSNRTVTNIYDTYLDDKLTPGPDIDDVGHGKI